jgi:methylmalonyl-CoA/ethylmalonyl-CoA epimerase
MTNHLDMLGLGPIDHVGIAVTDFEASVAYYQNTLGMTLHSIEKVEDQGVITAIFGDGIGRTELLGALNETSPVQVFLNKKGPGIHHLALRVNNIQQTLDELAQKGVQLIDKTPKIGAGGHQIAFIHPKSTGGVLLELTQSHSQNNH